MDPLNDSTAPPASAAASPLRRVRTRRAVLVGASGLAAAGAAAAVVAASQQGSGGDGPQPAQGTATTTTTATGTATAVAPSSTKQIADARTRAAHLLRRAGFGGTRAEIDAFAALDRKEAVDQLVDFERVDNSALDARITAAGYLRDTVDEMGERGQVIQDMQRWWLTRMAYTARPLEERMTFIWHGLLTSQLSKIGPQRSRTLRTQNELLREHALGRFDDLVQAASKDPAMMLYLDTAESTADHPNENYARELMELFTMGEGNYTEDDVREAARAFTGWAISRPPRPNIDINALTEEERRTLQRRIQAEFTPTFEFQARLHDGGTKTFLGETGAWNGEDIVRIIMRQPATGRYVVTRLWEEFAYPEPEEDVVDGLVSTWDASGHSIREVVRAILMTDAFFSERAYRSKVRSPIELFVNAVRAFEVETDFRTIRPEGAPGGGRGQYNAYTAMDQVLFEPPNVAGWPGGSTWLSSSTFFARLNFLDQVFLQRGAPADVPALAGIQGAAELVGRAAELLVDGALGAGAEALIAVHVETRRDARERAATAAYLVAASPEYQLI